MIEFLLCITLPTMLPTVKITTILPSTLILVYTSLVKGDSFARCTVRVGRERENLLGDVGFLGFYQ